MKSAWLISLTGFMLGIFIYVFFTDIVGPTTSTTNITSKHVAFSDVSNSIPPVINRIYNSLTVPMQFRYWMVSWSTFNPTLKQRLWTDDSILAFLKKRHPKLLTIYQSSVDPVERANIARYALLYTFGGVFVEMDLEATQPIINLLDNKACIVTNESIIHKELFYDHIKSPFLLSSSFIACRPRHPFFKLVLNLLPSNIRKNKGQDVAYSSGHLFLSLVYTFYASQVDQTLNNIVTVGAGYWFSPKVDTEKYQIMMDRCLQNNIDLLTINQLRVCEIFRISKGNIVSDNPKITTFGIHHYYHGSGTKSLTPGTPINILDIMPDLDVV